MKLLLDTHALLWWWNEDRRLSATAQALIAAPDANIMISAASAWEVATKARLGKLSDLRIAVADFISDIEEEGFEFLPITPAHALRAGSYEVKHADPFDRILAAQGELERMPLVTRDASFSDFPCETAW